MSSKTGPVGRVFHAMRGKPLGALGGLLIIVLVATALLAPVLAPYDPIKIKSSDRLQAPSLNHPLGTDDFGRDILSRVIYGARISMLLGLGAVAISTLLAAIIGVLSGYYGGRIDTVLQRCIDTMMAFPGFVVLLTIMAMLGQGLGNVILALGIGGTAGNARIIRSAVLAIRENQYVEVARAIGCQDWQIIARHILPNIAAPIMVVVTLGSAWRSSPSLP
jgi:ABC-type dipeptide/oligopeptide/nickel transport system permease subunit